MPNKVGIVIVTWDGWDLLERCLATVAAQTIADDLRIVIVDNGSKDGTVEHLHADYPHIQVIALPENTGFASPNNLGIVEALKDSGIEYILTLNNDIELTPTFVAELVASAERHPEAGSIQGKLFRLNKKEMIDAVGILVYPDMSAMNRGQYDIGAQLYNKEEEIFGPSASAALYRREALEKTVLPADNFFDAAYFAYYEDVDLAWRLRLAGYSSWYTPDAISYHAHSATGVSHSPFKAYHIHRNQYFNMIKLLPFPLLCIALAIMPFRYVLLASSVLKKRGPAAQLSKKTEGPSMVAIVLKSWLHVLSHLPYLLRMRRAVQRTRVVSVRTIWRWFKLYRANIRTMIYGQES